MQKFLVCIITVFILTSLPIKADDSFADIYPENTALFLEFNNTSPANSAYSKTALAQIIAEPQAQKFLEQTGKKLTEIFKLTTMMTQGIKVEDILSALGNHVSFGVYTENNIACALFIADFPQRVNPLQLVAAINPAGPNAQEFNLSFPLDPNNPYSILSAKIKGQRLMLSLSNNPQYLETITKPRTTSLASATDYLRASKMIGSNRLLTSYFNPHFLEVINSLNSSMQLNADLSILTPEQFNTIAYGICIEEPAFVQRTYFKSPTDSFPYDLITPPDMEQASFLPVDSSSAAISGCDFKRLQEFIIRSVILNSPQTMQMNEEERKALYTETVNTINETLQEIKDEYGINPVNDIIDNLSTQFALCIQETKTLPGLELFGFGGTTVIANIKNKAKLEAALTTGISTLVDKLHDQTATILKVDTDYGTINGIALANAVTVCYLIVDDRIIFSLNPAAIVNSLKQRESGENFLSSALSKDLGKLIGETAEKTGITEAPIRISYMHVDGISDMLNNTIALGASIGAIVYSSEESAKIRENNNGQLPFSPFPNPGVNPPEFIEFLAEALPIYLLPSRDVINKHLFDIWNASYITPEKEFIDIMYEPFPAGSFFFSKDFGKLVKAISYGMLAASAQNYSDNSKGGIPGF